MTGVVQNPPAFPTDAYPNGSASEGMSLRDYFASLAMQAMISKSSGQDTTGGKAGVPRVATFAYEYADAMLKARAA